MLFLATTPSTDFVQVALWLGYATIASLVLTVLAFVFKWGIRFRLVGITGFCVVLVVGSFGLGLGLLPRSDLPGALRYTVVYDNGGNQVVIVLNPKADQAITEESVRTTLQEAAFNQFSPSRFSPDGKNQMTIRARTILHSEPGLSELLYVGQVERSLSSRNDENMKVDVFAEQIARIPRSPAV